MKRFPEKNKVPGVCYAYTSDGIELPVVDVSHPAFALKIDGPEQKRLAEQFRREGSPLRQLPGPLRRVMLRFFLRGSVLAQGVRNARGTFMSGIDTYLLKLGPEMLGTAYAKPVDRRIAAALPALAVRLRLQDMAELMAEFMAPLLGEHPGRPVCLLNIAGGPAIDSLNALILLEKRRPGMLSEREVAIEVLDPDRDGPAFGQAALAALSAYGGPLQGIRIALRHVPYDWRDAHGLKLVVDQLSSSGAVALCSSEGGLFEYGSDEEIVSNLEVLRNSGELPAVAGSVTRNDELSLLLRETGGAATRPRGLPAFRRLVEKAGWRVSRAIERPFSDHVLLIPR